MTKQPIKNYRLEADIEDRILEYVNHMKADMDTVVRRRTGWLDRKLRQEARCYRDAYQTVEKFIIREIKLRNL